MTELGEDRVPGSAFEVSFGVEPSTSIVSVCDFTIVRTPMSMSQWGDRR